MRLRHATPIHNLASIQRSGLLTNRSKGKLKVVWLHSPSKSEWAALHTVKRHGGKVENVVVLEVEVPRHWLRRSRRGLRYSVWNIPASRIRRVITFADLAASPVAAWATARNGEEAVAATVATAKKRIGPANAVTLAGPCRPNEGNEPCNRLPQP